MIDVLPTKRGRFWDPDRDSRLNLPNEKALTAEHERDLRRISTETGAPRVATLEARRRLAERPPELATVSPSPIYTPKPRDVKPEPVARAPKPAKQAKATVPDGYTKLVDLAASWGVAASDCRAALRASTLTKPAFGWAFAPGDVARVKKICGIK